MDLTSIGKNLRKFRTEKRMMQETLAEKANLSSNYIGMIERGEKIPSLASLIRLANALDVTAICSFVMYYPLLMRSSHPFSLNASPLYRKRNKIEFMP